MIHDGLRAVRWVRHHADKYGLDESKIGVWGFSAGGHLASSIANHFGIAGEVKDDVDRESARPSFCILAYPVITMQYPYAHDGTRQNLLGSSPSTESVQEYSNEMQVTDSTPPCFLMASRDDNIVSVENTILFDEALRQNGVPSEMHLYDFGGHGAGLASGWPEPFRSWTAHLYAWLAQ